MKWIEICADYQCNSRCLGCHSANGGGPSMTTREVAGVLVSAHRQGARNLWFSGGEPTIRKDFLTIVKLARQIGFSTVKVQTNGMCLAYPDFLAAAVAAGITEVNFSLKGSTARMHDRFSRTPGTYDLMVRAIEATRAAGVPMEGDILVYRGNTPDLDGMIRTYADQGLARFNVWLFSPVDQGDRDLWAHVPRLSEVVPRIVAAMDAFPSARPDFVTSLHTPACTVPRTHWRCLFHSSGMDLWVANPGGRLFPLEASAIEGGHYLDGCERCARRPACGGVRKDYVDRFGPGEFQPVPA